MATSFGELKTDTFRLVEVSETSPVHWTEADIEGAVNDGVQELSDGGEFYETFATIKLKASTPYYDLRSILPQSYLRISAIWNSTTSTWLTAKTARELDERTTRTWETATGDSQYYIVRGLWWLGIFPTTTSTNKVLRVYYKALHPTLVHDSEEVKQLPDEYADAITSYAAYTLWADDGELKKALNYWNGYNEQEQKLKLHANSRTSHARVGRLGGYRTK